MPTCIRGALRSSIPPSVDMGRNIFRSDAPVVMIQAVGKVVHDLETPDKACQLCLDLKARG